MYIFIIIFVFTSLSLQIFIDYENQNCKLLIKRTIRLFHANLAAPIKINFRLIFYFFIIYINNMQVPTRLIL